MLGIRITKASLGKARLFLRPDDDRFNEVSAHVIATSYWKIDGLAPDLAVGLMIKHLHEWGWPVLPVRTSVQQRRRM